MLTVRVRADYAPSLKMTVVRPVMTLVHEVMERRQLMNLRRRAEAMEAT
jgi:heme exporter protein D